MAKSSNCLVELESQIKRDTLRDGQKRYYSTYLKLA